ncbi:MAG: hypothetical protein ABGX16_25965, partial [Pirellulales bacterium]
FFPLLLKQLLQKLRYTTWIGQWHLIYRDTDAMAHLAERAGMDGADLTIEAGPLGICPYIRATMG